jgi:oxygen-independent coproporphyrinogen-3 oxidase
MELARQAGITNLNLDLIYAIPGQSVEQWRGDLDRAIALSPTHLSCYALTYEPNTPLTVKMQRGDIRRADEDREATMFELTIDHLAAADFEQYEVSNFAMKQTASRHQAIKAQGNAGGPSKARGNSMASAFRCRHNLLYWQSANWLALGPSASGHIDGLRWKNSGHLGQYLESAGGAPVCDVEQLDRETAIGEQLMMRLRLTDGVPLAWCDEKLSESRLRAVGHFIDQGLLERTETHLRLTRRGLMVADSVVLELL